MKGLRSTLLGFLRCIMVHHTPWSWLHHQFYWDSRCPSSSLDSSTKREAVKTQAWMIRNSTEQCDGMMSDSRMFLKIKSMFQILLQTSFTCLNRFWILLNMFLVQMLPEDCSDAWYPRGMDRAQRAQRLNCGSRIRGTQKCTGRSNEDHAFCCAQGVRILKPSLWSYKMHRSQHFRQIYINRAYPVFFPHFCIFFSKLLDNLAHLEFIADEDMQSAWLFGFLKS